MLRNLGLVALGGAAGAASRFLVVRWALDRFGEGFPYGVLIVNVAGSFLLGVIVGLLLRGAALSQGTSALLAVGFLGAFTTFSTFAADTVVLSQRASLTAAALNLLANNALSILAAILGIALAGLLTASPRP